MDKILETLKLFFKLSKQDFERFITVVIIISFGFVLFFYVKEQKERQKDIDDAVKAAYKTNEATILYLQSKISEYTEALKDCNESNKKAYEYFLEKQYKKNEK